MLLASNIRKTRGGRYRIRLAHTGGMCRLFGINAGRREVHVGYWLTDAPDSILVESRRNPDGTGIGWFGADGVPHVHKAPLSAFSDPAFRSEAQEVSATTVVTHVRAATAGARSTVNTHPFLIDGLLVAHNGGFGGLPAVEGHLGPFLEKVEGDTDSERYAALIAKYTAEHGGDVSSGIAAAATWLAATVPLYSLNCVVASAGNLWALRYPEQRALHVARRRIDPGSGGQLRGSTALASHTVRAAEPVEVVVVASERIDDEENWRMLEPGELVHVGPDLELTSRIVLAEPPAHLHLLPGVDPNIDTF